ncbi:MAG: nucleotidyltransferase family protein [Promethearchaeota archaeon]
MYTIEDIKKKIRNYLLKHDVKKASLFGSIVRDEANKDSDIDILIEFKGKKSLLDLVQLKFELEELLNTKVDLLTYNSLHPLLKEKILSEQVKIL